ncbi:hypothetical protein BH11MYX2_BH11MYX2_00350 [soil metagenome]
MGDNANTRLQFLERVRDVWMHLPVFRAVAETEHLPTAARELDLVPSSLSRSIRQLEEILGTEVFDHSNKALVLNEQGKQLLASVRAAMRLIDDGVLAVRGDALAGVVTVAIPPQVSSSLLGPACAALYQRHPELGVSTIGILDHAIDSVLLRGGADVAIVTRPERDPSLSITELASLPRAAYVSRTGEIASDPPFVVVGTRAETVADGWPVHRTRTIAMWAHCERVAIEMCLSGALAFVAVARTVDVYRALLHTLPIDDIAALPLYMVSRRPIGAHPRTESVMAALCESLST